MNSNPLIISLCLAALMQIALPMNACAVDQVTSKANFALREVKRITVPDTVTDMAIAPNNLVWITFANSPRIMAYDVLTGHLIYTIKLNEVTTGAPVFMGTGKDALGVFVTVYGWIYVITQTGTVVSSQKIEGDNICFQKRAFKLSENEFGLCNDRGAIYSVTKQGIINSRPWASPAPSILPGRNVDTQIYSDSAVFSNGTVIQFGCNSDDPDPEVHKVIYEMLLIRQGSRGVFVTVPFFVKGLSIGMDSSGHELAVLIGNFFLAFMDSDGNMTSKKIRYAACDHEELVKLDQQTFLTDVKLAAPPGDFKILKFNLAGEMTEVAPINSGCITPFVVFQDDQQNYHMVNSFVDSTIRVLDYKTCVVEAQWTDRKTVDGGSSATLNSPVVVSKSTFIVQRGQDLVWLDWKK